MTQRIVLQNKNQGSRGVTLVEVMISLVILLIVFMGLIQASLVTIQSNVKNELRDEAVRITSDRMARLRTIAFTDALLTDTDGTPNSPGSPVDDDQDPLTAGVQTTVTRNVRNASVPFIVNKIVDDLDTDHKQISVRTTWTWQGEDFTHTIVATRGR